MLCSSKFIDFYRFLFHIKSANAINTLKFEVLEREKYILLIYARPYVKRFRRTFL